MKVDRAFLQQFCGEDMRGLGVYMSKPFSDDHFTYATNGWIIIRVPRLAEIGPTYPMPVNIQVLSFLPSIPGQFIALPKWQEPEKRTCPRCGGTGRARRCLECDGEGHLAFSSGYHDYEVECETCKGNGQSPGNGEQCERCDGRGALYKEQDPTVEIAGWLFHPEVLRQVELLGDVELFIPDDREQREVHQLRWSGGVGVAMGCKRG